MFRTDLLTAIAAATVGAIVAWEVRSYKAEAKDSSRSIARYMKGWVDGYDSAELQTKRELAKFVDHDKYKEWYGHDLFPSKD